MDVASEWLRSSFIPTSILILRPYYLFLSSKWLKNTNVNKGVWSRNDRKLRCTTYPSASHFWRDGRSRHFVVICCTVNTECYLFWVIFVPRTSITIDITVGSWTAPPNTTAVGQFTVVTVALCFALRCRTATVPAYLLAVVTSRWRDEHAMCMQQWNMY